MKVQTVHERVSRQVFTFDQRDIYRVVHEAAKANQLWGTKPDGASERVDVEWRSDSQSIQVVRTFTYADGEPQR